MLLILCFAMRCCADKRHYAAAAQRHDAVSLPAICRTPAPCLIRFMLTRCRWLLMLLRYFRHDATLIAMRDAIADAAVSMRAPAEATAGATRGMRRWRDARRWRHVP